MSKSKDRKSVREFDGGLDYGEVLDRRANFSAGLRVIKDYKGSEYNDLIKEWTIGNGDLWRQFWCIFGKLLYYYYVKKLQMFRSMDLAGCVCDYVPYMTDGERFSSNELDIRVKLSERGLDMIRKELYDTLSNIVRIARDESLLNEEDILGQLREYHFRFMLYGLGFFMSFPLKDGEYFSVRFKGLIFSEWLWWLYESIDEDGRGFVRGVMRVFRRDIREGNEELTFRQESGLNGSSLVPVSEAIPGVSRDEEFRARLSKLKNMKDWTADDFWNEMTYLYETCRTEGDWKSVKAILEMKAKAMGLINGDNQGGNTAVVLLTEKAVGALAQLGLSRKVVYEQ